jgi:hypothetical protein
MKTFTKKQFYEWINIQEDERTIQMANPCVEKGSCLLGLFFYDHGVEKSYVEEEAGKAVSFGLEVAKIENWVHRDKNLIKKNMWFSNFKGVKTFLRYRK